MLKKYKIGDRIYQFEPGQQPANAVEIVEGKYQPTFQKKTEPANKARKTTNKTRGTVKK